jgi:hypothetical protein
MDERYDTVRTVRDKRFRYIRNYRPDLPHGQHVQYQWQQAGYRAWERLFKAGKLNETQRRFWVERPEEELYDEAADPDEVNNLAALPEHRPTLDRMRAALRKHLLETRDNGFMPEGAPAESPQASRDDAQYPLAAILDLADVVTKRDPANVPGLIEKLADPNESIRYWAALGCVMLKDRAAPAKAALLKALEDSSPRVRVVAAEALCHLGETDRGLSSLATLLVEEADSRVRLQAANAIDHLGPIAKPIAAKVAQAATRDKDDYVKLATRYTSAALGEAPAKGE